MKRDKNGALLYDAFLALETRDECARFLEDLCTVTELQAMEQRLEVAVLLSRGEVYKDILTQTGASSATISRVNRCLRYGADGYRDVLPRICGTQEDK